MKNGQTILTTPDDEIAHVMCTSPCHPVSPIWWEKGGKKIEDQSPGVVIISWNNGTIMESHLLVAVTGDERRGTYSCVVSREDGETRRAFVIEGNKMLYHTYRAMKLHILFHTSLSCYATPDITDSRQTTSLNHPPPPPPLPPYLKVFMVQSRH